MKLEKHKWKVREVDFLEVVIRLEGIKIEKEKMKVILDLLVPKLVKDVQKFLELVYYYKRFVKNFVKITRLSYKLARKEQKQNGGLGKKSHLRC